MSRPFFPLFLAISLLPALATAAPEVLVDRTITRVDRSGQLKVGSSGDRASKLVAHLQQRADAYGLSDALASGLTLQTRARPIAGRSLEIMHVHGSIAGVPLSRPVAHALLDHADGGRVRVLTTEGPVPPLASMTVALTPTNAIIELEASGLPGSHGAVEANLVAVPGLSSTRLAYVIDPPLDLRNATNPVFLVDAETGGVRVAHDRVRTAKVRAFASNPVATPTAAEYDLLNLDNNPTHLIGPFFEAENCNEEGGWNCSANPTATPDNMGNFLYPAPDVTVPADNVQPDDIFAEVQMYYHADKFLEFLKGHGFSELQCHTDGERATLVANYKRIQNGNWEPYDNAFFSGDCGATMVFGQGTDVDFAYDGDVVYHELGHGVVEKQRDGGWLGGSRMLDEALAVDAGGLNEAIADFVSSAYAGDPIVADYVGKYWQKLEMDHIRDNSNQFVCPHDLVGEVHLDGEPFAALMWFAFQELGDPMIPVVLETTSLVPSDALLEEGAATLAEVAGTMIGASAKDWIDGEAQARGMMGDCPRVTTPDRLRREMFVRGVGTFEPYAPPPLQLLLEVPAGAETAVITWVAEAEEGGFGNNPQEPEPAIIMKEGEPLTFTYEDGPDAIMVDVNWDEGWLNLTEGTFEMPVTAGSNTYIAFVNFAANEMTVDEIEVTYPGVGGTGTGGGDTTGGGGTSGGGATDSASGGTGGGGTSDGGTTGATSAGTDGGETDTDGDDGGDAAGDGGGCGCHGDPRGSDLGWMLLATPLLLRRRRHRG